MTLGWLTQLQSLLLGKNHDVGQCEYRRVSVLQGVDQKSLQGAALLSWHSILNALGCPKALTKLTAGSVQQEVSGEITPSQIQPFPNLSVGVPELPQGHIKTGLLGSVSDPVGLGWGLRIHISNKFPGDPDAPDLETTLQEPLLSNLG